VKIRILGTRFVNRRLTQPAPVYAWGLKTVAALAISWLLALTAGPATAQTFTVLHPFSFDDGGPLEAGLILSGNTLYGTAENNGTYDSGSIFKVKTDGSGFTNFYNFTATSNLLYTNSDGAYPFASLALAGNTLYGTASRGGKGSGTVFKINTDGSGFTNLYTFNAATNAPYTNSDGAYPEAGLLFAGGRLYGTASGGGVYGNGTVFALSTNGSSFTNLHSFVLTEGGQPEGNLVLSGPTLFGTANNGGTNGTGSIFSITTNGMAFRNLYSFSSFSGPHSTNGDGAFPPAGLFLSSNVLFGTTGDGGLSGNGTVFSVTTNGTAFTNLHSFTATSGTPATNSDGAHPVGGLVLASNILYGTAYQGGTAGGGTLFLVATNGTGFTTLHNFTVPVADTNADGVNPAATLVLSNNVLYGTAYLGGQFGYGKVFSLWLSPCLSFVRLGTNIIITWPTNLAGFSLQSTTNLAAAPVWSAVLPAPVVVNTNNIVTNGISGTRKFYRLIH
jgi:uncharacterized repeat protein (TIGR03803 family)